MGYHFAIDYVKYPEKALERLQFELPKDMISGEYEIEIKLENKIAGSICFCTDAKSNDGWYTVANISINDAKVD